MFHWDCYKNHNLCTVLLNQCQGFIPDLDPSLRIFRIRSVVNSECFFSVSNPSTDKALKLS
jgi:hypothetical protein